MTQIDKQTYRGNYTDRASQSKNETNKKTDKYCKTSATYFLLFFFFYRT